MSVLAFESPTGRRPTQPELQNIRPPRSSRVSVNLRTAVIDQLAQLGKQLNPAFDVERFKQECGE
jgi:hypothetical protein